MPCSRNSGGRPSRNRLAGSATWPSALKMNDIDFLQDVAGRCPFCAVIKFMNYTVSASRGRRNGGKRPIELTWRELAEASAPGLELISCQFMASDRRWSSDAGQPGKV